MAFIQSIYAGNISKNAERAGRVYWSAALQLLKKEKALDLNILLCYFRSLSKNMKT
jgi:hypothetical protein